MKKCSKVTGWCKCRLSALGKSITLVCLSFFSLCLPCNREGERGYTEFVPYVRKHTGERGVRPLVTRHSSLRNLPVPSIYRSIYLSVRTRRVTPHRGTADKAMPSFAIRHESRTQMGICNDRPWSPGRRSCPGWASRRKGCMVVVTVILLTGIQQAATSSEYWLYTCFSYEVEHSSPRVVSMWFLAVRNIYEDLAWGFSTRLCSTE